MTNITLHSCSAELISHGSLDDIKRAWATSRPADPNPDMEKVLSMDVPVNELLPLHFELFAPILIREIICSFRNHVVWARSSRVDDLNDWKLFKGLDDQGVHECLKLHRLMQKEMTEKHQDDFRRHLPLAYMTKFSFSMSFRDLVRLMTHLTDFGSELFDDVFGALQQAIIFKAPELSEQTLLAISQGWYKAGPFFPDNFDDSEEKDALIGDFVSIGITTTLGLRSQIIRHRAIQINDSFGAFFHKRLWSSPMTSPVGMQLLMSKAFAAELVRKRSCWIAQRDLWEPIVKKIQATFGLGLMLPCDDGTCRFKRDNDLRKEGKDPAPPCPKYANMHKEKLTDEQHRAGLSYAAKHPDWNFWSTQLSWN